MASWNQVMRALPSFSILPMQFVCFDGVAGDWLVRPCTAPTVDIPVAVSQTGYDVPPNLVQALGGTYTPAAAVAGEELALYTVGDIAPVVLGASATAGSLIGFNSAGAAVPVAPGSGNYYGGIACQQGLTGGVIDIFVQFGKA